MLSVIDRITRKLVKNGECWEWTGSKADFGYGLMKVAGKRYRVHRLVYELHHGPIEDKTAVVRHICDNPPCCNIEHLLLGSKSDNSKDMVTRGRSDRMRGQKNGKSKLSDKQVDEIRKRYIAGESQGKLAKEYSVTQSHVSRIVTGRQRWSI